MTATFLDHINAELQKLQEAGLFKRERIMTSPQGAWVEANGKRVINLGGIHGPETADVKVDTLGLTKESEYPLDFFYAERHTGGSNMLLTTSLGLVPAMIN